MDATITQDTQQQHTKNAPNSNIVMIPDYKGNPHYYDFGTKNESFLITLLVECKNNPWYFFREVCRVPIRGAGTAPLYLHRAGCAAIWCFEHSIDFELVQPRQTYKTTTITAIAEYMMLFEYRNCDIPYLHKTETRCTDNIEILRDYICALPKFMNPWATYKHLPGAKPVVTHCLDGSRMSVSSYHL